MRSKLIVVLLLAVILLAGPSVVSAKSSFLSSFNQYYDTEDSRLDSCAVCHTGPNGGSLNPYGRAYSESGRNYASIETRDSDMDGFSNLEEIDALTFPGNANDQPEPASEVVPETVDNATGTPVDEITDDQSMDGSIVDEVQEGTITEVNDSGTTTEQESPGFGAILAFVGVMAVVCMKRR
ncbi:PGF-CTERM sorting domain-containing protein [Methanococcoides sp. FTZ1]|uniref:PGF-CTERM sorting domain-containing protein n=1 Tax=Methanococcoides sp. FTZ1 TaxID=3439061 RepID=UPI003F83BA3D